ncbi:MAG: hypothetical protein MZV64_62785 [Ignavibacteriales bacterium]|nr:hypothetical protein [Ignavibacteriales bacterium]
MRSMCECWKFASTFVPRTWPGRNPHPALTRLCARLQQGDSQPDLALGAAGVEWIGHLLHHVLGHAVAVVFHAGRPGGSHGNPRTHRCRSLWHSR